MCNVDTVETLELPERIYKIYALMWLFINQITAGLQPEMQNWSKKQVSDAK